MDLLNKVWTGQTDWLAAWDCLKSKESSPLALLLQEHLERPRSLLWGKKQRRYHVVFFIHAQPSITWTETRKDQEAWLPQILLLSVLGGRTRAVLQPCNLQSTKHGDLIWPWLKCPLLYKISSQKCPSQVLHIGYNPQGMGSHLHASKFIYFNRNKKSNHVTGHDHHRWMYYIRVKKYIPGVTFHEFLFGSLWIESHWPWNWGVSRHLATFHLPLKSHF